MCNHQTMICDLDLSPMKDFLEAFFLNPGTFIGLFAGFLVPAMFKWKPSELLALFALALNIPTIWFAIACLNGNGESAFVPSLLIYFWGTGGLGISLILWLMFGSGVLQRQAEREAAMEQATAGLAGPASDPVRLDGGVERGQVDVASTGIADHSGTPRRLATETTSEVVRSSRPNEAQLAVFLRIAAESIFCSFLASYIFQYVFQFATGSPIFQLSKAASLFAGIAWGGWRFRRVLSRRGSVRSQQSRL